MSNPYAAPQAAPRPAEAKSFADDPELKRLLFRRWICGYAIGCTLGAIGVVQCALAIAAASSGLLADYHFVLVAVGVTLLTVGAFAALGKTWPIYVAMALSIPWLGFLAIQLPSQLATERFLPAGVLVLLSFIMATPGLVVLLAVGCGLVIDRAIRRRRAALDQAALE